VPSKAAHVAAAVARGPSKQCQIAEPPGAEGDHRHGDEEDAGKHRDHRRRDRRGDQSRQVAPAERGDRNGQWRKIEQDDRGDRSRCDRREQESCRRAGSQSDQYQLNHFKLSRLISG
jgi:hypothetical protein